MSIFLCIKRGRINFSGSPAFFTLILLLVQLHTVSYVAQAQTQDSVRISTDTLGNNTDTSNIGKGRKFFSKGIFSSEVTPGGTAMRSAILPGWGQATNGGLHYIKIPFFYAAGATAGYFIFRNNREYQSFRRAYALRIDGDSTTIDIYDPLHPAEVNKYRRPESLLQNRESFRRNRDLSIILAVGVYAANILDAYVFAHLKEFDVNDDLSLQLRPLNFSNIAGTNAVTTGITLKFK